MAICHPCFLRFYWSGVAELRNGFVCERKWALRPLRCGDSSGFSAEGGDIPGPAPEVWEEEVRNRLGTAGLAETAEILRLRACNPPASREPGWMSGIAAGDTVPLCGLWRGYVCSMERLRSGPFYSSTRIVPWNIKQEGPCESQALSWGGGGGGSRGRHSHRSFLPENTPTPCSIASEREGEGGMATSTGSQEPPVRWQRP